MTKSSILVQFCSFLVCRLHFSHYWGWNKKIGLSELFWTSFQLFPKNPRSMSLNFFDHRYCFDTKSSILVQLCSFLVAMLLVSYNWLWNEKIGLSDPFWTSYYLFPKKVSEIFRSPNIVLVTKSSILVQLCLFLLDRLHFSHYWGWSKNIGLNESFWTSFYQFPKKYPNFFDQRTLFWWPNRKF